jgi:hypothetical protein
MRSTDKRPGRFRDDFGVKTSSFQGELESEGIL